MAAKRGPGAGGTATSQCQAQPARPAGPPCDIENIVVKCSHCGKAGHDREKFPGLKIFYHAPTGKKGSTPSQTFPGPWILGVTANSRSTATDQVTITVVMAHNPHPGRHVSYTLTGPDRSTATRTGASIPLTLAYPKSWWEAIASQGFGAIDRLFFPRHVTYQLLVASCGIRPRPGAFRSALIDLQVFPDDLFKLEIAIPPGKKKEGKVFIPNRNVTLASIDVSGKVSGRPDDYRQRIARSFKFSHNASDVTTKLGSGIVQTLIDARTQFFTIIGMIQNFGKNSPKVGWSVEVEVEFFSGTVELEWAYKEQATWTVKKYWKLAASLTLVAGSVKLSFGAECLGAVARVYGTISGSVKLEGNATSDRGKSGVSVTGKLEGALGVEGALGDFVSLKAEVKAGLEVKSSILIQPMRWTFGVNRTKAEAKATVKLGKNLFSREGSFKLWDAAPLVATRQILPTKSAAPAAAAAARR